MLPYNHIEYCVLAFNTPFQPELRSQRVLHHDESRIPWLRLITHIIWIFDGILQLMSIEWKLLIGASYIVFPDYIFDSL